MKPGGALAITAAAAASFLTGALLVGCPAAGTLSSSQPKPLLPPPSPPQYRVTDLGIDFHPTDLNDRGQIVGYRFYYNATKPPPRTALLWENGKQRKIGLPVDDKGFEHRLNNRGEVATRIWAIRKGSLPDGRQFGIPVSSYAAVWKNGKVQKLSLDGIAPPELNINRAVAINEAGQVAIDAGDSINGGARRVYLWEENKPIRDLGTLGEALSPKPMT